MEKKEKKEIEKDLQKALLLAGFGKVKITIKDETKGKKKDEKRNNY